MLKVLGRDRSINVRKVLWLLDELGWPSEREDWGVATRDPKLPEFLVLNPNGQVPVIVDDGFVLWESNAIMRYLAEKAGGALLGTGPHERALVDQWLTWQATELNPPWRYAVMALLRHAPGFNDPEQVAQSLNNWGAKMRILEQRLSDTGSYAGGESFTIADIALGLSVHRWRAIPADKPDLPAVSLYHERLRQRPAAREWISDTVF